MIKKRTYNFEFKFVILLLVLFLSICTVAAHQPRVELGINNTVTDPVIIKNPELGQAFYGILKGHPDYYEISSNKQFQLVISPLVPASPGLGGSLPSIKVTDSTGKIIINIAGTNSTWNPFIGEFHDYYLEGPEVSKNLPAGTYHIEVFNTNNQGKYLMIIGNETVFSADDYLQDFYNSPILKEQFFGKPITLLFIEFLGINLSLGIMIVLLIMLVFSRKSTEFSEITVKAGMKLKPFMLLGIIITSFLWAYVMYKYSFSIIGIANTLILLIAIILSGFVIYRISKNKIDQSTLLSTIILILLWWLFVYGSLLII